MPSHLSSVFFTVDVHGSWRLEGDKLLDHHDAPEVLLRQHLRSTVGHVLSSHSVLRLDAARDAAQTAVNEWVPPVTGLKVSGLVQLAVSAQDHDWAEQHARRHREGELEQEDELRRLAHLQRLLADPDLRRVWWMAHFPERLGDLPQLKTVLEDLPLPQPPGENDVRSDIRRFTEQLINVLQTSQQREIFLEALTRTLHTLGHHRLEATAARWHSPDDPGSTPE